MSVGTCLPCPVLHPLSPPQGHNPPPLPSSWDGDLGLKYSCVYLGVFLHCLEEVVLQPFLAVLTGAVKVVLLLQLLSALLAEVEEVNVGHGELLTFGDLAQSPELNSGTG